MRFKAPNTRPYKIPTHRRNTTIKKAPINWNVIMAISSAASAIIAIFLLYVGIRALKYTAKQIEDFREESQAQHLIEKVDEFDSPRYKAIRKVLAEKRLDPSTGTLKKMDIDDAPVEMFDELSFCNDLGVLTRHGALNVYDIWAEFSYWLFPMYADAQAIIKADQKGFPASWSNCDYLMGQVRKIEEQEDAGQQEKQPKEDIASFYFDELEENETHGMQRLK